jgi:hypothetical protein
MTPRRCAASLAAGARDLASIPPLTLSGNRRPLDRAQDPQMRMFVVTHKQTTTPPGALYDVIAVGGAPVPGAALRDDSGDNISARNRYYCELTATYWIWKNSRDDAVGICHYRRYFNLVPTELHSYSLLTVATLDRATAGLLSDPRQARTISRLLEQYDLIIPRALYQQNSIGDDYVRAHGRDEWGEFVRQLDELYGADRHSVRDETRFYGNNMLICRREIFDLYATQLFQVIDKVFAAIGERPDVPGARYQPGRYPGYLAERFMSAFVNANRLKHFEAQVIHIERI